MTTTSSSSTSKNSDESCRLLYQFLDTFSNTNLTEALCLSNHSLKGHEGGLVTFQLSIPSYATISDLVDIVQNFKLVMSYSSPTMSNVKRTTRYVDEENWCGNGLVAFDYNLVNHSKVDYDLQTTADDDADRTCVVKIHLPYGYATKLQFSQDGSSK